MSVSNLSSRNSGPQLLLTATPLALTALAEAALAVLSRMGERPVVEPNGTWRFTSKTPEGANFEIRLTGPDLPCTIPERLVPPAEIPLNPHWRETYRLVVSPPLVALDLCWRPGDALRIMTFSRGDWESQLRTMSDDLTRDSR